MVCFFVLSSRLFAEDVLAVWNYSNSVDQYTAAGGTALSSVQQQVTDLKNWLKCDQDSKNGYVAVWSTAAAALVELERFSCWVVMITVVVVVRAVHTNRKSCA